MTALRHLMTLWTRALALALAFAFPLFYDPFSSRACLGILMSFEATRNEARWIWSVFFPVDEDPVIRRSRDLFGSIDAAFPRRIECWVIESLNIGRLAICFKCLMHLLCLLERLSFQKMLYCWVFASFRYSQPTIDVNIPMKPSHSLGLPSQRDRPVSQVPLVSPGLK
jgi:hypothetical protein